MNVLWFDRSGLELAVHVQGGTILVKAGTEVGVMAVKIAQGTRVVCAQVFEFWEGVGDSDMDFWEIRVGECLVDQKLEVGKFRTHVSGMTDDITQSASNGGLWWSWGGNGCWGGRIVMGCPPSGFACLPRSRHNRRRVLWRCWGHSGYGGSEGDRLNRCQSHVRFGGTRGSGGWGIKVPNRKAQGQVREGEGGHDGDKIYSGRGS